MKAVRNRKWRIGVGAGLAAVATVAALWAQPIAGQASSTADAETLDSKVQQIMARLEYRHSSFGIEFYSLDTNQPIYQHEADKLFTPGSTTKLLTEGTALAVLGADYRFHTKVYRTGPIETDGTLKGDLILVAGGDPNLSGRIRPDGTMAFENEDHSYQGSPDTKAVPGDPLAVIREIAGQIAAKGVKKITGQVMVDASLFPEGRRELGTQVVISPIVVNDNLVDVTVAPGSGAGAAASVKISPETSYAKFINQVKTVEAGKDTDVEMQPDVLVPDGTHTVTVTGTMAADSKSILFAYRVPQPSRFAEIALVDALREKGIKAEARSIGPKEDFKTLAGTYYTDANLLADHVSPPLSEEIKVTLKVSQNLHASMMPYILGALAAHKTTDIDQGGFDLEHDFLTKAGLDMTGASQGDGAGGAESAFYTPDFIVHYLAYMAKRPDFDLFYRALPILGVDGTLWNIQTQSSAVGQVHAKTGTFAAYNPLDKNLMVTGKGLAGYTTTAAGQHLAFAIYINRVAVPIEDPEATTKIVGQAAGEIAAAGYSLPATSAAEGSSSSRPVTQQTDPGGFRRTFTEIGTAHSSDGARQTVGDYDVIIRNGHILDGTGNNWYAADVAIRGDRIAAIGKLANAHAKQEIDARGLIVSPGFIDMLGQSETALLIDNRSLSKLSQGITSEITGEGGSIAPQNEKTLGPEKPMLEHFHLTFDWHDLNGYFRRLEHDGTPLNLGTYVGAAQVREAVLGDDNRAPTAAELEQMKALVAEEMRQGAMGLSTALIYPPGHYAKTDELIALAKVASQYGGIYASHMRSEGRTETAAIDEALRIGREAGLPVEIFHLKIAGKDRWGQMNLVVKKIEAARASGVDVAVDMYPYLAGATALASALPPWVADGGPAKMMDRLHDPKVRARIRLEMAAPHADWENLYYASGGAGGVMIASVVDESLKRFEGKTVAEMAATMHKPPVDALMDFCLADHLQTGALYFIASEPDLRTGLKQPWTSIGLDASEESLDGPLFGPHDHPRTWGSMPRFLGHYVLGNDADHLHLVPLPEAIRKITSLPAQREHLIDRGLLKPGYFADVTIFDPARIIDHATYTQPSQLSTGVAYVFVNGQLEFEHGTLTGAKAGRALRGPGYNAGASSARNAELGARRSSAAIAVANR
jgi:N-acyl-D-amino-acid deacylase